MTSKDFGLKIDPQPLLSHFVTATRYKMTSQTYNLPPPKANR
jgi:hypothetical protein